MRFVRSETTSMKSWQGSDWMIVSHEISTSEAIIEPIASGKTFQLSEPVTNYEFDPDAAGEELWEDIEME